MLPRAAVLVLLGVLGVGCSTDPDEPQVVPRTTPTTAAPAPVVTALPRAQARRLGLEAVAALKRDEPDRAIALIRRGGDVNARDDLLDSVFLYAGAEGYLDVVRVALAHGADSRVLNRFGGTALIPAAEHAHLAVIRLLLRTDVAVDHVNDLGWTALGEAVALGDGGPRSQEAVRLLLAAGADPQARDRFGRTPLENARRLGYDEIARDLSVAE